ncbi:MAG: glycosyltransferase family 4 protein [Anaerolineaceae bacterium]
MKIILFANTEWYLYNFRLSLAQALRGEGYEVVLISPPGKYTHCLEEAGFRWKPFPLSRRGTNPLAELATVWRLRNLYRMEKPDIVHHFTIKCVLYGSLAAHTSGIPIRGIINAITGLGFVFIGRGWREGGLRRLVKALYRVALKNTQVVFQNVDDRALFFDLGLVAENQACLIPGSGVDTSRFVVEPDQPEPALVVLAARMLWDKGVGEFVEAAKILKEQGVVARFALVGDTDPNYPTCVPEQQLNEWQSAGIVEWWGWQDDMLAVYSRAHIVCLPSYREGLPRTLAEAAACGRALVATDVPGCRSIVRQGENGFLVPVRNGKALAEALRTLILDASLRKKMGHCGREIVVREYSTEKVLADTLKLYKSWAVAGGA